MKLNDMTLSDLRQLHHGLGQVIDAADRLAVLNEDVQIDLTPGMPVVMTAAWTMPACDGQNYDPGPLAVAVVEEVVPASGSGESPEPVGIGEVADGGASQAPAVSGASAGTGVARPLTFKTGKLSPEERAEIHALSAKGWNAAKIALHLNRRIVAVNALLKPPGRGAKKSETPAGQPAETARSVEPAVGAAPQVEGDQPDGQRKSGEQPAEAKPVQNVPKAGGTSPPFHDTRPQEQRELSFALDFLQMPKGWDEELDLDLAEAVAVGRRYNELALDFGESERVLEDRYKALTKTIRDDRNRVTISGQTHLLAELRRRVIACRGAAA